MHAYSHIPVKAEKAKASYEKRRGELPIPINLKDYLNQDQMFSLRQMESFGWHLAFVRRPMFQTAMAVVTNDAESVYGVLEQDGSINTDTPVHLRH